VSLYTATILWERNNQLFTDNQYSRAHRWLFDGGLEVPASASPQIVPLPFSVAENVDPEEAFVASLSSCHMLFFLAIAARQKLTVDRYQDAAEGLLEKNPQGHLAMTLVTLKPQVEFKGDHPGMDVVDQIHQRAHQECFIANSVVTQIVIEAQA